MVWVWNIFGPALPTARAAELLGGCCTRGAPERVNIVLGSSKRVCVCSSASVCGGVGSGLCVRVWVWVWGGRGEGGHMYGQKVDARSIANDPRRSFFQFLATVASVRSRQKLSWGGSFPPHFRLSFPWCYNAIANSYPHPLFAKTDRARARAHLHVLAIT
jgi:hypothetical protein